MQKLKGVMYPFSNKLKRISITFMVLGVLGIGYGFLTAPKNIAQTQKILEKQEHHSDDSHSEIHKNETHKNEEKSHAHAEHSEHQNHLKHAHHQLQNRPWSAFYVALFFFFGVTLCVLTFYAIQRVAQSGWSIVLFRIMEGITGNLLPITIILFTFLLLGAAHVHHLFVWMAEGVLDPQSSHYDPIIEGKSFWLNVPGWIFRAFLYIAGWNIFRYFLRKNSLLQDNCSNLKFYKKNFKISVGYLVFFLATESMMSWDWIMSLDPHWFSTLFAWYIFASLLVCAVTTIAMVSIYLNSKGYTPFLNNSHLHDLAKFMFGFSIFWTYLWFSQFMLIWYSDMPEETTYFVQRFEEYKFIFLGMIPLNFILPVLMLVNSDYKRVPHFIIGTGIVILCGHYVDIFVMIMPATVGEQWFIGIPEISSVLFFLGLFIYATFSSIAKAPLLTKNNPFLRESEHFHY